MDRQDQLMCITACFFYWSGSNGLCLMSQCSNENWSWPLFGRWRGFI